MRAIGPGGFTGVLMASAPRGAAGNGEHGLCGGRSTAEGRKDSAPDPGRRVVVDSLE